MNDTKPWYTSKTIWAGILGTMRGIYMVLQSTLPQYTNIHLPPIPGTLDSMLALFLGAATVHGRWTADSSIAPFGGSSGQSAG